MIRFMVSLLVPLFFWGALHNGDQMARWNFFTDRVATLRTIRLGAADVSINIRKTVEYMRIDETEKHEALVEGIQTNSLIQPSKIIGENGRVTGIEFIRTWLEKIETPLYRSSVPIEVSQFTVKADSVIAALGQSPNSEALSQGLGGFDADRYTSAMGGVSE